MKVNGKSLQDHQRSRKVFDVNTCWSSIANRADLRHGDKRKLRKAKMKRWRNFWVCQYSVRFTFEVVLLICESATSYVIVLVIFQFSKIYQCLSVLGYRKQIASGEVKFEELAEQFSDCSSAKRGGDLGEFTAGQMQKAFEEAAFALSPGEMSEEVWTDSGVHIILRVY